MILFYQFMAKIHLVHNEMEIPALREETEYGCKKLLLMQNYCQKLKFKIGVKKYHCSLKIDSFDNPLVVVSL